MEPQPAVRGEIPLSRGYRLVCLSEPNGGMAVRVLREMPVPFKPRYVTRRIRVAPGFWGLLVQPCAQEVELVDLRIRLDREVVMVGLGEDWVGWVSRRRFALAVAQFLGEARGGRPAPLPGSAEAIWAARRRTAPTATRVEDGRGGRLEAVALPREAGCVLRRRVPREDGSLAVGIFRGRTYEEASTLYRRYLRRMLR